ncbi:MAG TPA: vanillate O-demethylase oxidoreductase VanB, partial [Polyangiaceae bacterium]
SFFWHPYAVDPNVDYSDETPTKVTFELLEAGDSGTWLTLVESGFDKVPAARRAKAFQMNDNGWDIQMKRIDTYVGAASGG